MGLLLLVLDLTKDLTEVIYDLDNIYDQIMVLNEDF